MKTTRIFGVLAASVLMLAVSVQSRADTAAAKSCKDGTTSAATGRGACSGHGGVLKAAKTQSAGSAATAASPASAPTASAAAAPAAPAAQAPAATSPTAGTQASPAGSATHASTAPATSAPESKSPSVAAADTDPAGATAKCKDGTYSKSKHHAGSCSHHGGVAQWLTGAK